MPGKNTSAEKQSLKKSRRKVRVDSYVKKGLRYAMGNYTDRTVLYHSSFPVGQGIAHIVAYRLVKGEVSLGLMATIEEILGELLPADTPEQAARRGILAGLCWDIEAMLRMGGKSGFHFLCDDENQMFDESLRKSKASAWATQKMMDEPDEED